MVQYQELDRTLAAIADPTRRGVLEQLGTEGEASISDLAEPFAISLTGMKKHVAILERAELVATEKVGRTRRCRLAQRRLDELEGWIESYKRMLEDRLDRFGEMLERTNTKGEPQ